MRSLSHTIVLVLGAALLASIRAQVPPTPCAADLALLANAAENTWRVPLHAHFDDTVGGSYGLWAAGAEYKASFHDGFSFYPRRRPDQPLVHLRWRTVSIRCGEVELRTDAPRAHTTAWRHVLDHGNVAEVYDVLAGGVEQSFVLPRPVGPGDLVVRGRIDTALTAAVTPTAASQALTFASGGEPVVRSGAALAFDAAGRRTPVTTHFDGTHIELRLAASFLADAVFPVTLDPLTTPVTLAVPPALIVHSAVAANNASAAGKAMVVYTRNFAAGDDDAYGFLCDKDFANIVQVYADVTTAWSTVDVDVAHVRSAPTPRFAIAVQRDFSATSRGVRVYFHGDTNTTLNSGVTLFPDAPTGYRRQRPCISGDADGLSGDCLLAFEQEPATVVPSQATQVWVTNLDQVPSIAWNYVVDDGASYDAEQPALVPIRGGVGNTDWVLVWRRRDAGLGVDVLMVGRMTPARTREGYAMTSILGTMGELAVAGSWAGDPTGRFTVAWVASSGLGTQTLEAMRFDLGSSGPPILQPQRQLVSGGTGVLGDVAMEHDGESRSHWAVTYTRAIVGVGTSANVLRLGAHAAITETQSLHPSADNPGALAIAFVSRMSRFLVTYRTNGALRELRGTIFRYPSDGVTTLYGPTCRLGSTIVAPSPYAGSEFWRVEVRPVAAFDVVLFIVGFAPTSVPLGPFGFPPQCSLVVDPSTAVMISFVNQGAGGSATLPLPLPDLPLFIGNLFVQAAVFPVGGTQFVSNGLGVQVR